MARKQVEGQLDLIEDTPEIKTAKTHIKQYDKMLNENRMARKVMREAEKKKRGKVFEAMDASQIKPDSDGARHLSIDGYDWRFHQDSELKIEKRKIKEDDGYEDLAEDDGDDE
jgi:hypothetical protein